jgi:hypothetical protein
MMNKFIFVPLFLLTTPIIIWGLLGQPFQNSFLLNNDTMLYSLLFLMIISAIGMIFSGVNLHYDNGTTKIYIGYPLAITKLCFLKLFLFEIKFELWTFIFAFIFFTVGIVYGFLISFKGARRLYLEKD